MVEHRLAKVMPAMHWRYSAHSNEHFPFRFYASARGGEGTDARDRLVIAEIFNPVDDQGDRLIISADIMDDDGVILEEGPRYTVPIPIEAQLLKNSLRLNAQCTVGYGHCNI